MTRMPLRLPLFSVFGLVGSYKLQRLGLRECFKQHESRRSATSTLRGDPGRMGSTSFEWCKHTDDRGVDWASKVGALVPFL